MFAIGIRRHQIVILALCTTCLFLLIASIMLLGKLEEGFVKLQIARTFPAGFTRRAHDEKFPVSSRPSILMIGDSRIEQWDPSFLSGDFEVINIGHGGQTSSQVLLQLEAGAMPSGQIAFVQVGINDIHWINGLGPDDVSASEIVEQCKRNLEKIAIKLQDAGYFVVMSTIFPPGDPPRARQRFWPDNAEGLISDLNATIHALESGRLYVFDSHSILVGDDGRRIRSEFLDGDFFLHVNSSAYEQLSEKLRDTILELEDRGFKVTMMTEKQGSAERAIRDIKSTY